MVDNYTFILFYQLGIQVFKTENESEKVSYGFIVVLAPLTQLYIKQQCTSKPVHFWPQCHDKAQTG